LTQGPYLSQTLRLLEGFDLKKMGFNSADYIHTVIEAEKLALAGSRRVLRRSETL
jgi:gamma-glutamyltranspeptidase/glutathione hydrolase